MSLSWVLPLCLLLSQMLEILDEFESGHHTVARRYGTSRKNWVALPRLQRCGIDTVRANVK